MLDDSLARKVCEAMLKMSIYVIHFFYLIVPSGTMRIRS